MSVRDQLIEAAARLYAEAGYRGATTRRIAVEAGVTDGSLLGGVKRRRDGSVETDSIVMRASSGTVRRVKGEHRKGTH